MPNDEIMVLERVSHIIAALGKPIKLPKGIVLPKPIALPKFTISDGVLEGINRFVQTLENIKLVVSVPLTMLLTEINRQRTKGNLLEAAGWLPHYTMPLDQISEAYGPDEINAIITAHYRNEFDTVEASFLARVAQYKLDDELTAAFREALACHRAGAYRATVRLLFPEIERVACKELYDGKRKYIFEAGPTRAKQREAGITSLPDFFEHGMRLPLGHILDFEYGYQLLLKFGNHLYSKVPDNVDAIALIAADPVPNRHAAVHGIVVYSTMQNSLNMLIMADFIFHLISAMKEHMSDE